MRHFPHFLAVVFVAAIAQPAWAQEAPETGFIEIRGHGEVTAEPDMAYINSGVTTQAETAREALNANSEAMAELIEVLKAAGIEDRDIQTSNFSVQPQYVYSDRRDENGYNQAPKIDGYQVSNTVSVRVRSLDSLGPVLDQAVTVGANTINSISFGVDETDPLYNEARRDAFADAVEKAELYAEAAGVTLGRVLNISESGFVPLPKTMDAQVMRMEAAPAASVPIQGGELSYTIDVSVRWELEQ